MSRTVVIVQRRLPRYREALFNRMREQLAAEGLRLRLIHGQSTAAEESKKDVGHLDWAEPLPNTYLFGDRLVWQRFAPVVKDAELVVVGQENKLLYNLLALSIERPRRIAFWGHGRNMQAPSSQALGERFKQWLALRVDWWFAYTELTRELLKTLGFRDERITVLDNAIDTSALARQLADVSDESLAAKRRELALANGPVAAFVGSLYGDKRLDFLVAAADRLHEKTPSLTLLMVGDGPMRGYLDQAAASRPWLRILGAQHGAAKAEILKLADVMLNPGLVGLGILDSFVAGVPMITTDCRIHSPEISYLESGVNGLMTANDLAVYVDATHALLTDPQRRAAMAAQALASSRHYTIEHMADRYATGMQRCLETVAAR